VIKNFSRKLLLTVFFVGFIFSIPFFSYFFERNKTGNDSVSTADASALYEKENISLPFRLKIPVIAVDAAIKQVGLTSAGAMDVPKGPDDVAWFNLGPIPGELGSAVIDGHAGYKNNRSAVFDNLYKLQKGDKIYVTNQSGAINIFVVRSIERYDPKANAGKVFSSNDGLSHLNLITCTGVWDSVAKSHSQRLIVFTDKEM
jgi:LPXTG-site transpeptidase (sortase) family protein